MTSKDDPLRNYKSPTDMGMGLTKKGIIDDRIVRKAAEKEIIRRYRRYMAAYKAGHESISTVNRMKKLLRKAELSIPV
jgi:uncharacterized protein (UPF0371 family)